MSQKKDEMKHKKLSPGPFLIPMPTVLVGSMVEGKPNFLTAAFCGLVNYKPATIACGLSPNHYTSQGIESCHEFSVNIPSAKDVAITDYCGIHSGKKVNKSKLFKTFLGELPGAPMIQSFPLCAQCRVIQTLALAMDTIYVGEIMHVYAKTSFCKGGKPDWRKIDPLLFTFPDASYWRLGEVVAKAWDVGKKYTKAGSSSGGKNSA